MRLAMEGYMNGDGSLGWIAEFSVSVYSSYDWPVQQLDDFGIKLQNSAERQTLALMLKKALTDAGCTDIVINDQIWKVHDGRS